MAKMIVRLHPVEQDALLRLAKKERRDPRDEAALIIRAHLKRRGLLPVNAIPTERKANVAAQEQTTDETVQ